MSFHRLGKGACGPLLALCGLIAVLWAGSYRSAAQVRLPVEQGSSRWSVTSYRGIVSLVRIHEHPTTRAASAVVRPTNEQAAARWDDQYWSGALAGFSVEDAQVWLGDADGRLVVRRWSGVNLPYWLLFSAAALAPLHGAYVLVRARRRSARNRCGACGYELGDGATCQACVARAVLIGGASPRVRLVRPATAM